MYCITEYRVLGKKGEGTFSEVLKCQNVKDGGYWACKKLKHQYKRWVQMMTVLAGPRRFSPPSPSPTQMVGLMYVDLLVT